MRAGSTTTLLFPSFAATVTTFVGAFVQWRAARPYLDLAALAALRLWSRARFGGPAHHRRHLDALRHGHPRDTLTAMFNPLPAIALLPLALIWFGLGIGSLIFVHHPFRDLGGRRSTPIRLPARSA
jgi:NitT/TauT family transport system permease protein